jgi:hypothetical protein
VKQFALNGPTEKNPAVLYIIGKTNDQMVQFSIIEVKGHTSDVVFEYFMQEVKFEK